MSYYYKYNFVSPEPIYAIVKEELKSYFDSGAVDDLLFPTYLNKCLSSLGKGSYNIVEEVLYLEDYEVRLPDNFYAVREAWLCADINGVPYRTPNSFYSQAASVDTIQISPVTVAGTACHNTDCDNDACDGVACMPEIIQAVYKTNREVTYSYRKMYLLKPGNISVQDKCSLDCKNFGSSAPDSFDIRDNKLVTNFKCGTIYLVFYATDYDNKENQLIPDNNRVADYIEQYLKYKVFEQLSNQVNDETFKQIHEKMRYYEQKSDEAYIMAETEMKKQTAYQKQHAIKRNLNRNQMYELPNSSRRIRRK